MTDPRYMLDALNSFLTHKQIFLLVKLMEETAEVQKACSKILRFGLVATDLVHPETRYNNVQLLGDEMEDVRKAYDALLKTITET